MAEKNNAQNKRAYIKKNYVRFPLDLRPEVLADFRAACEANNTTPTAEIKKFIAAYIEKNEPSD